MSLQMPLEEAQAPGMAQPATDTRDALLAMEVGDVAEVPSLFPALTPEPVVLQALVVNPGRSVQFAVLFMEILIGKRTLTKNEQGEYAWH